MSIEVSGGAASFEAKLDDLTTQARLMREAGSGLRGLSDDVGRATLNGSVLAAALLCPLEVGRAEAAVALATTGPSGLFPVGAGLEGSGLLVEAAVTTYRTADAVGHDLFDRLTTAGGFVLGLGAPVLLVGGAAAWFATHPQDLWTLVTDPQAYAAQVQRTMFENPWLMEVATHLAPGFLQGAALSGSALLGFGAGSLFGPGMAGALGTGLPVAVLFGAGGHWPTTDYESAVAGLVALGQRFGMFQDVGDWPATRIDHLPDDAVAPTSVRGIFDQQSSLGREGSEGEVQIVKVTGPDGTTRWIVQIPGTQDWSPTRTNNPVDLTTNVSLMSQEQRTAMERQVEKAMAAAGIPSTDEIMLTGHSQGGITAAAMASDSDLRGRYNITSVVTGGSPVARMDIPDSVSVLSVEHRQDPVPMLDGASNPSRDNWVTVRADVSSTAVTAATGKPPIPGDAHGTNFYAQTGQVIDQSTDPSVTAWRQDNAKFFTGTTEVSRWNVSGVQK